MSVKEPSVYFHGGGILTVFVVSKLQVLDFRLVFLF